MPSLALEGDDRFVSGACRYLDYPPTSPEDRRLVIPVQFGGTGQLIHAVVDTGSHWCILNPRWANLLANSATALENTFMRIRGRRIKGQLWRVDVELKADAGLGIGCIVDATVFIPDEETDWPLPDFLGLDGFLDRIRFAVDPEQNLFYFGALGDA